MPAILHSQSILEINIDQHQNTKCCPSSVQLQGSSYVEEVNNSFPQCMDIRNDKTDWSRIVTFFFVKTELQEIGKTKRIFEY